MAKQPWFDHSQVESSASWREDPKLKLVDVTANELQKTEREILVQAGFVTAWLPIKEVEDNQDGTYTMPEWLAKEKGLA